MYSIRTLATVLALTPFLAPVVQHAEDDGILTVDDVVLEHFTPMHAPASHLHQLAYDIAGIQRDVYATNGMDYTTVNNLFAFGDSIMIYDTPEAAASATALLTSLDQAYESSHEAEEVVSVPIRYLSQERMHQLLPTFFDGTYVIVNEQSTVLLSGNTQDTQRVKALIESLDKPAPQVMLSCYLVKGTNTPDINDDRIPKDLETHLASLLSYESLELYSHAVLRTTVHPTTGSIEMWMAPDNDERHGVLELSPGGFDSETGTLTLNECSFSLAYEQGPPTPVFSTSTAIRAGEYTVLGATGLSPMFVVLRFDLL